MTRKDYKLIAAAISEYSNEQDTVSSVAFSIANALQRNNKAFNYDKFIEACGKAING